MWSTDVGQRRERPLTPARGGTWPDGFEAVPTERPADGHLVERGDRSGLHRGRPGSNGTFAGRGRTFDPANVDGIGR